MAGLNWDKTRVQNKIRQNGFERAVETYAPVAKKKPKKKLRGKKRGASSAKQGAIKGEEISAKQQRRLVHKENERKAGSARASKAGRKALHEAQMIAAKEKRQKAVAERFAKIEELKRNDPNYEARLAARAANHKPWMRKVVVVSKQQGRRKILVRQGLSAIAVTSNKNERS